MGGGALQIQTYLSTYSLSSQYGIAGIKTPKNIVRCCVG